MTDIKLICHRPKCGGPMVIKKAHGGKFFIGHDRCRCLSPTWHQAFNSPKEAVEDHLKKMEHSR